MLHGAGAHQLADGEPGRELLRASSGRPRRTEAPRGHRTAARAACARAGPSRSSRRVATIAWTRRRDGRLLLGEDRQLARRGLCASARHCEAIGHASHDGERGVQTVAPSSMSAWFHAPGSSLATMASASDLRGAHAALPHVLVDREDAREHPRDVAVDEPDRLSERDARDRAGRVAADARNLEEPFAVARHDAAVRRPRPARLRGGAARDGSNQGRSRPRARRPAALRRARAPWESASGIARSTGMTVSTRVCWSMISLTQIAYGSRVLRHGRSRRHASYQASSVSWRYATCAGCERDLILPLREQVTSESRRLRRPVVLHSGRRADLQRRVPARNLLVDRHAGPLDRLRRHARLDLPPHRRVHGLQLREEHE